MILLDTHTLLWWINGDKSLPKGVLHLIQKESRSEGLFLSSISVWEIAMLYKKGRLQLAYDLLSWIERLESMPALQWIPADHRILLKSVLLPEPFHPDPADRILVATAMSIGAILVTKDGKMREYPHVKTYWED